MTLGICFPAIETYRAADGTPLVVRRWPQQRPRAHVVLLHGIVSHGGWYTASCAHLAAGGCAVHLLERRGSGLNSGPRGDVDRWQTWPEDVEAYLQQLDDGRPRILGGISWGGKLAAVVARRSPDLLNGLALLCPGIYAHQQPGLLRRCALAAARLPAIGERDVRVPLDDPALFTNDAAHRGYIARDPLVLRRITLRFALADQRLTRAARQAPPSLTMPLLLVLAEGDRIVNNRRMQAFFEASAAVDKAVFEYPGAAHTLEFDRVAPRYMADLLAWIEHVAD